MTNCLQSAKKFRKPIFLVFIVFLSINVDGQHSLIKFDYPINSPDTDELSPVLSKDEKTLFLTRVGSLDFDRTLIVDKQDLSQILSETDYEKKLSEIYSQIASKKINNAIMSGFNQDIWTIQMSDHVPQLLNHPSYPLNNALPNSICSNYGGHDRYITINQFAEIGGIEKGFSYTEMTEDGEFTFPKPIHIDGFNKQGSQVNLCMSADNKYLFLAMEEKNSLGEMDLYICQKIGENHYSEPKNLGNQINTSYKEATPMLSQDMKRLYFVSNRPESLGGTDIFFVERLDDTFLAWGKPIRLNPPVNTEFDEMYPMVSSDGKYIYYTSNIDGTFDIFRAILERKDNFEVSLTVNIFKDGKASPAELIWGEAYTNEKDGYFRVRNGTHKIKCTENKPLVLFAKNRDYKTVEVIFDPQELFNQGKEEFTVDLHLTKGVIKSPSLTHHPKLMGIIENQDEVGSDLKEQKGTVILKNIMFERSTANVLPQSYPAINTLGKHLRKYPNLRIEIIGHTDNVGNKEHLLTLSLDRAQSIKNILCDQGIETERIFVKGLGDQEPITDNSTEIQKKKNRRVEVKVLPQEI